MSNIENELATANKELNDARAMECICLNYIKKLGDCYCNRSIAIHDAKVHLEVIIKKSMEHTS
jgi:hypothetical protein